MFGLSVALTTPFSQAGEIDDYLMVAHSKWVLQNGANSITLFGTTGEGTSISQVEKLKTLQKAGYRSSLLNSRLADLLYNIKQYEAI